MQVILDYQLHDYLSFILTELYKEKKEDINIINDLLRKKLFATIGYADFESSGPRSCSDYEEELQRFQIWLKKTSFLNPDLNLNCSFEGLDRNNKLSVQMKLFSDKTKAQHINYIKGKFGLIKYEPTYSIPVTFDEAQLQSSKSLLKKEEIVFAIKILIESLNEAK
ncbi:2440_t:CDS:2, partial [Dentiscutata heterogama]